MPDKKNTALWVVALVILVSITWSCTNTASQLASENVHSKEMLDRFAGMPTEPVSTNQWFGSYETVNTKPAASLPVASANERSISSAALESASAYARSMDTYGLIISHRGKVQFEDYADGFEVSSLFDSQSMHKPLVSLLVGAAIDDGAIESIDDPLQKYLPKWQADPRGLITIRDLLYMESGLRQPVVGATLEDDGTRAFLTTDIADFVYKLDSERPSGDAFNFNFLSTQILSLVLESATGERYADYLSKRLWQRIDAGPAQVRLDRKDGNAHTFCCINVTPRGWHQIGSLIMNDGRYNEDQVISSEWLGAMKTSSRATHMGMLVWLATPQTGYRQYTETRTVRATAPVSAPYLAEDLLFFEGRGGQRMYVSPKRHLVVVRIGEVRMEWDDAKFMNLILSGISSPDGATIENPAPDYGQQAAWSVQPNQQDSSTPDEAKKSAAFYIHPTTYRDEVRWNASLDDGMTNSLTDGVVAGQASVFEGCCDVYAPRYRQASLRSVFDQTGNGTQAYDVAYGDVKKAFDVFLKSIGDRPFIIAGHSQGGYHAKRLLTEVSLDESLKQRLIAGYVIGIGIPNALYESDFRELKPCLTPTQVGCVASWNSYTPEAAYQQVTARTLQNFKREVAWTGNSKVQCTNPVNFMDDGSVDATGLELIVTADMRSLFNPVAPKVNPMSLPRSPATAGLTKVSCDGGALTVAGDFPDVLKPMVLPGGVLHLADYALFHASIAENATLRSEAFVKQGL